jgi:hypothetical protein
MFASAVVSYDINETNIAIYTQRSKDKYLQPLKQSQMCDNRKLLLLALTSCDILVLLLINQPTCLHWKFKAMVSVSFEFDLTGVIYMHFRFKGHRNNFE